MPVGACPNWLWVAEEMTHIASVYHIDFRSIPFQKLVQKNQVKVLRKDVIGPLLPRGIRKSTFTPKVILRDSYSALLGESYAGNRKDCVHAYFQHPGSHMLAKTPRTV